jgi:hypothetical protein
MHSTNSFLYTVIERIRGYLDDPDFDAKYSNDFIVRHIISPVMVDVWSRLNMNLDNPVVLRQEITFDENTEYYQLPPGVGEIWRIACRDLDGKIIDEVMPRNEFHPHGVGWAVEGNTLRVDPKQESLAGGTWTIYYVPSGDVSPHYATDGAMAGDRRTVTLSASPTLGALDRRENSYAGQILRILPASGQVEERVIESHDVTTNQVVTRLEFDSSVSGDLTYEIAPIGMQSLYEAIAAGGSLKLGAYRKITNTHYQMIQQQYRSAIKSATDNLANLQMRTGKYYQKNTVDNSGYDEISMYGTFKGRYH